MVKRILTRAGKGPFDVTSAETSLTRNTIATNVGNLVFSHAAHKLLATPDTEIVPNRHRVIPSEAPAINAEYDAFVVPLANAFRPGFEHHLLRLTELIERLEIPVVVFGVGVQAGLDCDLTPLASLNDTVKRFTAAVLERSPSIGVRGEVTAEYLNGLGFSDIDVIGCPSMFLHGDTMDVERPDTGLGPDARIAVNVSPHLEVAPYFEDSPYHGWMGELVEANLRRYPGLVYIPQEISALDLQLFGGRTEDLGRSNAIPLYVSHRMYAEDRIRFFVDPWTWMSYLSELDFAFGTRIHGTITALLAGTPAFVIAHDSRTLELARYFELPHATIEELPAGVDAADLYARTDLAAMHRALPDRFQRMVAFLDRHGLECSFGPAGGAQAFDERLAAVTFPEAVRPLGPDTAPARLRSLRDDNVELRKRVDHLAGKVRSIESARDKLSERLSRKEREVHHLSARLDRLDRMVRSSPYRRARRLAGRTLRRLGLKDNRP